MKYTSADKTALSKIEVASGKYTVVCFPRYTMSPGRRPMGMCVRLNRMSAIPITVTTTPIATSALPKSATTKV